MTQPAAVVMRETIVEAPDLEGLYRTHSRAILALLGRLLGPAVDPADLLQDVFVIAWRKRHTLRAEIAFSFLCGTAIRLASNARMRSRVRRLLGLDAARELAGEQDPVREVEHRESVRAVYEALDGLSEKKRTVFILYEFQGMSGPEIAAQLGCPVHTVWSRLMHARREFNDRLKGLTGAPGDSEGGQQA